MAEGTKRKVGKRGQVTLPKHLREAFDISGGDEVTIRMEDDAIVIEKPTSRADLAEGYRRYADRDRELAAEMSGVSREADSTLGDAPDWER